YDYERYSSERGMYFDIREYLPSSNNEDELLSLIKSNNQKSIVEATQLFRQEFVTAYGNATMKSVEVIAQELSL
ncbi:CDP-glycerol glycerophosphotransferase family protein, partial [Parabacteroides johnsonii]|uniref:CDP-glycerol glycerophosphotransferase family protein n=1 Tax=Parabacteroides johnsonii TaxID=387661 RepID=UPI002671A6C0